MNKLLLVLVLGLVSLLVAGQPAFSQLPKPPKVPPSPQTQALLKQVGDVYAQAFAAAPQTPAGQLAASRQANRGLGAFSGQPEAIHQVADHQIPGPQGTIPVRIYRPSADKKLPILVYFHGGAFTAGDLDTYDAPLRALANRAGCIIVAVQYRLAPEHPFPAAPEDCYAAAKWVANHAAELGSDPKRVAVGGDSAGGLLATVTALMARDRNGPALVYQALLYPNTDLAAEAKYASWQDYDGVVLTRVGMDANLSQYLTAGTDRSTPYASPIRARSLAGLPPALVVTGEFDPLRDEGEAYAAQLKAAGVPVTSTRYPGMIHGFVQFAGSLEESRQLISQTGQALRTAFVK